MFLWVQQNNPSLNQIAVCFYIYISESRHLEVMIKSSISTPPWVPRILLWIWLSSMLVTQLPTSCYKYQTNFSVNYYSTELRLWIDDYTIGKKIRCIHSPISWLQIYTKWSFPDRFQFLIGKSDITNVLNGEISFSNPSSYSKVIPCNNSRGYCTHHFCHSFQPLWWLMWPYLKSLIANIFMSTCTDCQMSFSANKKWIKRPLASYIFGIDAKRVKPSFYLPYPLKCQSHICGFLVRKRTTGNDNMTFLWLSRILNPFWPEDVIRYGQWNPEICHGTLDNE